MEALDKLVLPDEHQRLKIYEEALKIVFNNPDEFICNNLLNGYETMFELSVYDDIEALKLFPEFIDQKPYDKGFGVSWFVSLHKDPGVHQKRITVLRNCIEILNIKTMRFGDKKMLKKDFVFGRKTIAKAGAELFFQDNVKHTSTGILYEFHTVMGVSLWLKETQFKHKRIVPNF